MYVAGIDSSTQSTKVLVLDTDSGQVVRQGRASHPGGTEVDPGEWFTALQAAVTDAGGLEDVAALAVGGQQHGMVLLDADGQVIRPAQLWNDTKAAPAAAALVEEKGREFWAEAVGSVPVASLTVSKLRWIADNEPQNVGRIAAICLPHDWLTWKIMGSGRLEDLVTDRSDASGTGYVDCDDASYRYDILAHALRISEAEARQIILPRIAGPAEVVGEASAEFGGGKVAPGCGDNAGAALGLNLAHGEASVSLGTSGVVAARSDHPVRDAVGGVTGFMDASGQWLPLACTLNGSLVQDYFCRILGTDYKELDALAQAGEPGCGGMVMIPYFVGERTPNLPDATGRILNLRPEAMTRENFARLAFESLACHMRATLEAVRAGGIEISSAMVVGGAAKSSVLLQILADIMQIPLSLPAPGEYVAKGAARQAALAAGVEVGPKWDPQVIKRVSPGQAPPSWEIFRNAMGDLL
ncbi:xylulose kinase [Winkia sp. ACRQY]|uniref:xylulokinase n=1 Tax=Winkia sp. ACRQY TaxID=2918182 RepID=UPI001EF2F41F|nr:FGGY family carbohydrate kinase [Winkia sp. ACRQY]MCG7302833.1 xylulose kinase [Winkia sp. ACRQY]